ncbi:hypothetical protein KKI23_03625 [Patescibacteria group bacterium]|nr:hypothetical protein [Patescibacteria group bacterium]
MNRWLVLGVLLLIAAGCSPPLGEPLDITLDDYDQVPFSNLAELRREQLVIYRHQDKEVIGKIANLRCDGYDLIVDPDGEIHNENQERIRVWIYDGDSILSRVIHQEDISCLVQLVLRRENGGQ